MGLRVDPESELAGSPQVCLADIHLATLPSSLDSNLGFRPNFELNMSENSELNEAGGDERVDLSDLEEGEAPCTNVAVVLRESQQMVEEGNASPRQEVHPPEGRALPYHHTTRHFTTFYKVRDWSLVITQLVLVIGDSNLSRIPRHKYPLVQIDSFLGAQIHHLKEILGKLDPCLTTQKVVLAVGLNDCLRNNQLGTMTKQFQLLLSCAKTVFPRAEIVVPVIQFSPQLQSKHRILMGKLNQALEESCKTLKGIAEDQFRVNQDLIHWTSETANKILHSWMSQLN
ncbi:hypothetical protein VZT92_006067 [Zoarces viviparus]|uniref:SGNH hydrolase-type esterase domain-containing protein n=1 Tax=Zoarces viviparus TaxID=48416 RepID=A0AAW1FN50_ZOAVI